MQEGAGRERLGGFGGSCLPPVFFLAGTLVAFARILPNLAGSSAAAWDTSQMVWNLWWMKYALVDLRTNPFFTDYLFHPDRLSLLFHTFTPLYGVVSIPLQLILPEGSGPILSFNLLLMASFVLAGWFACLLAVRESGSRLAGYVAGTAYTFSAFHFSVVDQLNNASIQWLPLGLWLLLRYLDDGRRRDAGAFGVVFFVQLFTDYMITVQLAVACGFVLLMRLFGARERARELRRGGVLVASSAPAAVVLGLLALQASGEARWPVAPDPRLAAYRSADLLGFVLPGEGHFPYAPLVEAVNAGYPPRPPGAALHDGVRGHVVFLGWAPVVGAMLGLALGSRRSRFLWAGLAGLCLWLALGPVLHVYGERVDGMPSLYSMLTRLPLVGLGKTPYRFVVGASLGIAILAGVGVAALHEATRRRGPLGRVPVALLVLGMGLEALTLLPRARLEFNEVTRALAADRRPGAVVIVDQSSFVLGEAAMLQQVVHHRPIDFGYVARYHDRLAHPRGASASEILRRLRNAQHTGVFRFAVSPSLDAESSSTDRSTREVVAWLRENAASRRELGDWVLWEL